MHSELLCGLETEKNPTSRITTRWVRALKRNHHSGQIRSRPRYFLIAGLKKVGLSRALSLWPWMEKSIIFHMTFSSVTLWHQRYLSGFNPHMDRNIEALLKIFNMWKSLSRCVLRLIWSDVRLRSFYLLARPSGQLSGQERYCSYHLFVPPLFWFSPALIDGRSLFTFGSSCQ